MATTHNEQENSTRELTNLIDVIAAETAVDPMAEPETTVEITVEVERVVEVETVVEEDVAVTTMVTETVVTEIIEEITDKSVVETVIEEVIVETAVIETTAIIEKPAVTEMPAAKEPVRSPNPPKKQRQKKKPAVTSKDIIRWFASCGRCSFFLTAYQLIESDIDLETAVSRTKGEWITLDWNYKIRNLVDESYGCQVDTGIYHLDAACPECRRRFIFHSNEYRSSFRIALNPAIKR